MGYGAFYDAFVSNGFKDFRKWFLNAYLQFCANHKAKSKEKKKFVGMVWKRSGSIFVKKIGSTI